jgi:hypothetical protein
MSHSILELFLNNLMKTMTPYKRTFSFLFGHVCFCISKVFFFKKSLHSKASIKDVEIRRTVVGFVIKMTKITGAKKQ